MSTANILLNVNGIEVIYNHVILVLKGVSLQVPEGRIVGKIALRYRGGQSVDVVAGSTVRRVLRRDTKTSVTVTGLPAEVDQPAHQLCLDGHRHQRRLVLQTVAGADLVHGDGRRHPGQRDDLG